MSLAAVKDLTTREHKLGLELTELATDAVRDLVGKHAKVVPIVIVALPDRGRGLAFGIADGNLKDLSDDERAAVCQVLAHCIESVKAATRRS